MTMSNNVNIISASLGTVIDSICVFISIHELSVFDFPLRDI